VAQRAEQTGQALPLLFPRSAWVAGAPVARPMGGPVLSSRTRDRHHRGHLHRENEHARGAAAPFTTTVFGYSLPVLWPSADNTNEALAVMLRPWQCTSPTPGAVGPTLRTKRHAVTCTSADEPRHGVSRCFSAADGA